MEGLISAVQAYAEKKVPMIPAYFHESMVMLPQSLILRVFVENRKVKAETSERVYDIKKILKEVEEKLDPTRFVRVSQSEIVNLKKVKSFDFSLSGTIRMELGNGTDTWVSRRRVKAVKDVLSGGGEL